MLNTTALLTDRYELTMLQAARHSGLAKRNCVFEVFTRSLPTSRRFGVVAGTGRLLEAIRDFRFGDQSLSWLAKEQIVNSEVIDWLANYKFSGNISGYAEGDLYFAYSPILVVEATFEDAVILETLILSTFNYDTAVASAAARMRIAAGNRKLAEMGSRRVNEIAAVGAARAAFIAGFDATSNLEAGRTWGIPTMGTAGHAFTLLHETEAQAFESQLKTFGERTTLLVDTYDIEAAIRKAIELAPNLGAIRIDSGDLRVEVTKARKLLDQLGATNTKITVTNDLNEFTIAELADVAVDSYGVGTSVATGSGVATSGFVYKLVSYQDANGDWNSVAKRSAQKTNFGGRKNAVRELSNGFASKELIGAVTVSENKRELLVPLVVDGAIETKYLGQAGVQLAKAKHLEAISELADSAKSLEPGEPAIVTEFH